ncbi:MAG: biotin--[acetyl-CoA-carboxylase] ligase [Porcipelethomonas sp.]
MTVKEKVAYELSCSGEYISGESLAGKLGVSRNTIWKAVKSLREDGFDIEAVSNKGYALKKTPYIITESSIRKFLPGNDSRRLYVFDSIDSTNNCAKELARQGAPNGTAVISDMQTAGRGRMGRTFCSPPGKSIYMSVVLRPDTSMEESQLITSCVAAAAADAVDRICGTDIKIKWVNDLFLGGKKICGILTEASVSFESGTLDFAVVGIGINVRSVRDVFDSELLKTASSLEDETGRIFDRSQIIAAVLENIDIYMCNMSSGSFLNEYRRRSFIIGNHVSVTKNGNEREALAVGISANAGLEVEYSDGTREILNSGEARIIPK